MIRKLKLRFIVLATSSLLVLLAVTVIGMNLMSYRSVIKEADAVLSVLSKNNGRFPEYFGERGDFYADKQRGTADDSRAQEELPEDINGSPDGETENGAAPGLDLPSDGGLSEDPRAKAGERLPPGMSPETPFESRYFSVTLDGSGNPVSTDISRIASVQEESAADYARQALEDGGETGFIGRYRFSSTDTSDGVRIVFLDCGRRLDSFHSFMYASIIMSAAGLAVVFTVIFILSGRIIRPIAESYAKQRQFITDAGHEIKTPLTVIGANVDILESEFGANESLTDIADQTRRLCTLTNELVELSRMEEPERAGAKVEFPISDVVSEAAAPFRAVATAQGKELVCCIQPMLTFCGDAEAIHRLIGVLLDNAVKYSPRGGRIKLELTRQARSVRISTVNTSTFPIDREQLSRVFDRFYRADTSRNSETGGHGIGLSIAKAVTETHGGRIRASSDSNGDFRITVTLPV